MLIFFSCFSLLNILPKIDVKLVNPTVAVSNFEYHQNGSSVILRYPCSTQVCTPFELILEPGTYLIELWGAQGGVTTSNFGGFGSYTSGILKNNKLNTFYVYLGGSGGINEVATYNGGGKGTAYCGCGGGASDIRLVNGSWNNFLSLKSRIMVAGGGGGMTTWYASTSGGSGGSLNGFSGPTISASGSPLTPATGATQTSGGNGAISTTPEYPNHYSGTNGGFGFAGQCPSTNWGGGGGGGYYGGGGGGASSNHVGTGSGGSSFISGNPGCDSISETSTEGSIIHTSQPNHYSGLYFTNPIMRTFNTGIPSPDGYLTSYNVGKGVAKISALFESYSSLSCDSILVKTVFIMFFHLQFIIFILSH